MANDAAQLATTEPPVLPVPGRPAESSHGLTIGYVTSRFPVLTETFILYEVLGIERSGVRVEFYPLLREKAKIVHPDALPLVERAHFLPFLSLPIIASQLWFLRRHPRRYLRTVGLALRGTFGSLNFFVGAIGIFPKVVHAARLMATSGVTHVHCHFATHAALAGFVIHRLTGIPYSFTAAGSDLHVDRTMLCRKASEAAFVVAISEFNRQVIVGECGEPVAPKVRVLRSGIDTAYFRPRDGVRPPGPLRILSVGRLIEVKGQAYLIDACRRLADSGVDFSCDLVGDGPDETRLARQIDGARLGDRVRLIGSRSRHEIARLLADADVFVAPSVPTSEGKREGIPIVLMEALAAGVPVVASRLSGIPELVEDGRVGLLVPPRDADALAAALEDLARDPELRARLGRAGREKVVREYDAYTNAATLTRWFNRAPVARRA